MLARGKQCTRSTTGLILRKLPSGAGLHQHQLNYAVPAPSPQHGELCETSVCYGSLVYEAIGASVERAALLGVRSWKPG